MDAVPSPVGPVRGPVIVAGMHRSGTSLVGSLLEAAGVSMGPRKLAADRNNVRGYFEDLDFLTLQREMLAAAVPADDGGHPDWGWTESELLDPAAFGAFEGRADALLASRSGSTQLWGWKDPRTSLLLDFWAPRVPDARYVFVYRHPWDVADSMQRLGADVFLRNPGYAYSIWRFYNAPLLDFYRRHRDRAVLVSTEALARDPSRFFALLADKVGVAHHDGLGGEMAQLFERELLRGLPPEDPLPTFIAAAHPRCAELLSALDGEADLSGAGTWSAAPLRPGDSAEPRVSVVVPCYDHGELLLEALASVERSVPEPHEVIVVNDGSRQPRTVEVLGILRSAGFRIIDQENLGLATARNRGFEEARAEYVVPLDADNRLRPGYTTGAVEVFAARPEVGMVYADRAEFGLRNAILKAAPLVIDSFLVGNVIDACTVMRKDLWRDCGGFDASMPIPGWEDWDLWLSAIERGWSLEALPIVGFEYRVRPDSMVTTFADGGSRRRVLEHVVAKHRGFFERHLVGVVFTGQSIAHDSAQLIRRFEAAVQGALAERDEARSRCGELAADLDRVQVSLADLARESHSERVALEEAARELVVLRASRDQLQTERDGLAAEREQLRAEREQLRAERERLLTELQSWSNRMAFVERTRAWRLRQRLVDIKTRWGAGGKTTSRGLD